MAQDNYLPPGFYNEDCLPRMREYPDKHFDLAIVDPPYGGGFTEGGGCQGWFSKYHQGEQANKRELGVHFHERGRSKKYQEIYSADTAEPEESIDGSMPKRKIIAWDIAPGEEYFKELFRISKNQIIWGGNYFDLTPTRCFVIWRKTNIPAKGFTMSPVEYAWTSFNRNAELIEVGSSGNANYVRFHPTQKPVALYEELLMRFAEKGDKILDTHVGSGSSLIACYNLGYEYTGFEIDETYYSLAKERIADEMAQIRIDIDYAAVTKHHFGEE